MDEFVAFEVGRGDAFFLNRNGKNILVDGGEKLSKAYSIGYLLEKENIKNLNVVVVTHSDSDHCKGILGLLEHYAIKIEELWLPGIWKKGLGELLSDPITFYSRLAKEIQNKEILEGSLEEYAEKHPEIDVEPIPDSGDDDVEISSLDYYSYYGDFLWWHLNVGSTFDLKKRKMLCSAFENAERIRKLYVAGYSAGAKIRWFMFGQPDKTSGDMDLRPLNSKESRNNTMYSASCVLDFLSLTISNKKSLVFVSPETDSQNAVYFTADSDLDGVTNLAPQKTCIVTAPHHGSAANKGVYRKFPEDAVWIRSDCNSVNRPCLDFKTRRFRFCTLCNQPHSIKHSVRLRPIGSCRTSFPQCKCL